MVEACVRSAAGSTSSPSASAWEGRLTGTPFYFYTAATLRIVLHAVRLKANTELD